MSRFYDCITGFRDNVCLYGPEFGAQSIKKGRKCNPIYIGSFIILLVIRFCFAGNRADIRGQDCLG
jgi:hypothetical protein